MGFWHTQQILEGNWLLLPLYEEFMQVSSKVSHEVNRSSATPAIRTDLSNDGHATGRPKMTSLLLATWYYNG